MSGQGGQDSTTVLNPGLGGDTIDDTLVVQSDGTTQAKRSRVEIGVTEDAIPTLVGDQNPFPVEMNQEAILLQEIRDELRELRKLLVYFINT